jgi:hypothetical protein
VLHDIIREILMEQIDIEVAHQAIEDPRELVAAVRATAADFVVLTVDVRRRRGFCADLLAREPGLKILAVAGDGRRGYLYELLPHELALGELTPQKLVEAVCQTPGSGAPL